MSASVAAKLAPSAHSKPWGLERPPETLAPGLKALWTADIGRLGELWFEPEAGARPDLLLKLLFTSERLSVQVHPDDAHARANGLPGGKDEAWYVLSAEPDARIGIGLPGATATTDLRAAALDGSIVDLMAWVEVEPGDVIYVPGGTVHALGGGLVLAEIQQNVDITWRLYDYGRHRPLHLEEGLGVARRGDGPPTSKRLGEGAGRHVRTSGGAFVLEEWIGPMAGRAAPTTPLWIVPVSAAVTVDGVPLQPGEAMLVPHDCHVTVGDGVALAAHAGGAVQPGLFAPAAVLPAAA